MKVLLALLLATSVAHAETTDEFCRRTTKYVPLNTEGAVNIGAELMRHAAVQKTYVACLKRRAYQAAP